MTILKLSLGLTVLVALGAATVFLSGPEIAAPTPASLAEGDALTGLPWNGSASLAEVGWQPVFSGEDRSQGILYGHYVPGAQGARTFLIRETTTTDNWDTSEQEIWSFTSSFDIHTVATERKDKFFLCGTPDQPGSPDKYVIERWKKVVVSLFPVGGGPSAAETVQVKRKELYRGAALGPIANIGADPDGRFLLVVASEPRRLWKLFPDGTLDVQYFASQIPHLEDVMYLTPAHHEVLGRTWILEGGLEWTLLSDIDNDGVFESFQTIDLDTWRDDYTDSVHWLDDYLALE